MTVFRSPFPIVYAKDVQRSARFYGDAFGFELTFRWPDEGALEYAYLELGEQAIGIAAIDGNMLHGKTVVEGSPPRFELCIYTDDTDAACGHLLGLDAPQLKAPEDQPWGERLAYFEDPDGNPIHVTAKIA